jgi:2-iminobutanoate/2-iminopropanoate deaminase
MQPARPGTKVAYGTAPPFPVAMAVRAGDFVFTSGMGDHDFDPKAVTYDARGLVVSDGSGVKPRSVAEETAGVIRNLAATLQLAGCTLEDLVEVTVWLRDPRDFIEMNEEYVKHFKGSYPTRNVVRADFVFDCRLEMKGIAYKPLDAAPPRRRRPAKAR